MELESYLTANQDKTDEILRRFAQLDTRLQSDQSLEAQSSSSRQLVTERPDLGECSRVYTEFGGKNECRFMWRYFKARRGALFRLLNQLRMVATSQDKSFALALAFVLDNSHRHADWLTLGRKGKARSDSAGAGLGAGEMVEAGHGRKRQQSGTNPSEPSPV